MPVEESTPFQRQQRIKWAQLIRRVWLEDLVGMLSALEGLEDLSLTTNGALLPG